MVQRTQAAGLSLIEMLISLALVSILTVALVDSMQGFGSQLGVVRADQTDLRSENSLESMARAVRNAWLVEEPSAGTLSVINAYGETTSFWLRGDELMVTRPSGRAGVLVDGVADFDVATLDMQRLRPATAATRTGEWWDQPVAEWEQLTVPLEESAPLALGFTLRTEAPEDLNVVEGVQELAVGATLEAVALPLAFAWPVNDGDTGPEPDDGKVAICHRGHVIRVSGNGNAVNAHLAHGDTLGPCPPPEDTVSVCHNGFTVQVSDGAASLHQGHGDTLGACAVEGVLPDPAASSLVCELYEAMAPDDGRPVGAPVGSVSFPVTSLPTAGWSWVPASALGPDYQILCHLPPTASSDYHTMAVRNDEVANHLAHGDTIGACLTDEVESDTPVLVYAVPGATVNLDLSALTDVVLPGRAYTIVARLEGRGTLLMTGAVGDGSALSGVASDPLGSGAFRPFSRRVQRGLAGEATYTQTRAADVVTLVSMTLTRTDGVVLSRSASVFGQTAIEDPWLGGVAGELPALELSGH